MLSVQTLANALFNVKINTLSNREYLETMMSEAKDLPPDLAAPFFNEFASLHLPTFLSLVRANWSTTRLNSVFAGFTLQMMFTNAYRRWARDSGSATVVQFVKELMDWVDQRWNADVEDEFTPSNSDNVASWAGHLAHLTLFITLTLACVRRPPNRASTIALLARFKNPNLTMKVFDFQAKVTPMSKTPGTKIKGTDITSLAVLIYLTFDMNWFYDGADKEMNEDLAVRLVHDASFEGVWFDCEATGSSPCVELPPGESMDACGKCLLVRYCSRDHQREHWPEHKKVCFRPTWDVKSEP